MNSSQFKLSDKFTVRVIFLLAVFGLMTSLSSVVKVWKFNEVMEDKGPPLPYMEVLPDDTEYLKTRIRYLEDKMSSPLNDDLAFILTTNIEKSIWIFHALFQFIFLLSLYLWYFLNNKANKSVSSGGKVT